MTLKHVINYLVMLSVLCTMQVSARTNIGQVDNQFKAAYAKGDALANEGYQESDKAKVDEAKKYLKDIDTLIAGVEKASDAQTPAVQKWLTSARTKRNFLNDSVIAADKALRHERATEKVRETVEKGKKSEEIAQRQSAARKEAEKRAKETDKLFKQTTQELVALKEQLAKTSQACAQSNKAELDALKMQITQLTKELETTKQAHQASVKKLDDQAKEFAQKLTESDQQKVASAVAAQKKSMEAEVARLKDELNQNNALSKSLENTIAQEQKAAQAAKNDVTKLANQITTLQDTMRNYATGMARATEMLEKLRNQNNELQEENETLKSVPVITPGMTQEEAKSLQSELDAAEANVGILTEKLAKAEKDLEAAQQKCTAETIKQAQEYIAFSNALNQSKSLLQLLGNLTPGHPFETKLSQFAKYQRILEALNKSIDDSAIGTVNKAGYTALGKKLEGLKEIQF